MNDFKEELFKNINEDWNDFLKQQDNLDYFNELIDKLIIEYNEYDIYPEVSNILKPMKLSSLNDIKVVIIGQDPYHTPGVADGLAFSSKQTKVPPSLKNIFIELNNDIGVLNTNPDLTSWAKQGVFLLNTVLTVRKGQAKSHHKIGWSEFVINLIKYIDENSSIIFVLWGNDAQKYEKYLNNAYVIKGYHPSPLAQGKFFNGKYFSIINEYLKNQNKKMIDWSTSNEI